MFQGELILGALVLGAHGINGSRASWAEVCSSVLTCDFSFPLDGVLTCSSLRGILQVKFNVAVTTLVW